MAPRLSRKRKSDEMDNAPATPTKSPAGKQLKVTASQKQAMIDNLQLEITERARHLRAHYALQCTDLRARIERRINRVPLAMRKMTMGELLAKHEASNTAQSHGAIATAGQAKPTPSTAAIAQKPTQRQGEPIIQPQRSRKRKSSEIHIVSDKENDEPAHDIESSTVASSSVAGDTVPVAKNTKRAKIATEPKSIPAKPAVSRTQRKGAKTNTANVLSPRSHNSRTLPRSPIKPTNIGIENGSIIPSSPTKSSPAKLTATTIPRPNSPLKSAATALRRGASKLAQAARPSSRDKESAQAANLSPIGKMLPPPRPVPASLNTDTFSARMGLQRSASQTSVSATSEQSSASFMTSGSGATVESSSTTIVKSKRGTTKISNTTTKALAKASAAVGRGKKTAPSSTVLSPKSANSAATKKAAAGVKKTATTTAAKKATGVTAAPASTGRVLRKRN